MTMDLVVRDSSGQSVDAETRPSMLEADCRIELDELLHNRLEEAIGVYGVSGVLGVLWDLMGKRPPQQWGAIRESIGKCAEVVEQCEALMEE